MDDLEQYLYWYQACERDMTYILGARCKDGVVLVSDRKITLGSAESDYEDKVFMDVLNVVVGSSGVSGLFDKFRDRIRAYVTQHPSANIDDFITEIENQTKSINDTYRDRLGNQVFDVLVGVKLQPFGAVLKYIYPIGFAESVRRYKVIGHGEPYGSIFLKQLLKPDKIASMTMEEVAELGYFVIKYIEKFKIDNTVGVGDNKPQIWFIPHANPPSNATEDEKLLYNPHQADDIILSKMENNTKKRLEKYSKSIINNFKIHPT